MPLDLFTGPEYFPLYLRYRSHIIHNLGDLYIDHEEKVKFSRTLLANVSDIYFQILSIYGVFFILEIMSSFMSSL